MSRALVRVTLFVAATVALTAYLAAEIVGFEPGADRYGLSASFADVSGLRSGDPVKLAGVPIGEVTGVTVEDGDAVVSFSIDDDVGLPADSTVAVRWLNLIGQRYLALEPGQRQDVLAPGGRVERSRDVVDLSELVSQLAPLAQSVSPERLNTILATLLEAFDGNDAAFDALLRDVDAILRTLVERESTIDEMLVDYDEITAALASRDRQIQAMLSNLVTVSETFADNEDVLVDALRELSGFAGGLDELLAASAADLGSTLESLAVLTGTAADHVTELEAAVGELPTVFEALLPVVNRGEWLRVNVLCLTVATGPCPIPTFFGHEVPDALSGGGR